MDGVPEALRPTNSPAELSGTEFLRLLGRGEISALDYASACADRIEALDPTLKAWKHFDREQLEQRARALDDRISREGITGRMAGVPIGVKDIFNTYDMPTGMGSPILDSYTPGNDARVVSNLRLENGLIAGKTVTAEFAVHHPGPTVNPWDAVRSPGTSSSGSAVSVAARMVPAALASQTGGSIIRPASYCGVMGFKPSFGLVPRTGVLKTTDTLDSIGIMARTVDDLRMLFEVMRVRGHNYPISEMALNDPDRQQVVDRPWRVGIVKGPKSELEDPSAKAAFAAFADGLSRLGCEVSEFILPAEFETAHDAHETVYRRALSYYFKLEWGARADLFSASLRTMIDGGLEISPERYHAATRTQAALARRFDEIVRRFDVLMCLSTADVAPEGLHAPDPADHCLIWTMCGAPAISLPLLRGKLGLPLGVQVVARRFADYKALAFAQVLETEAGD